jgi:flagellar biosynthesis/type III secretory pathway M-ring protein FliF/YscJ
MKLKLPPKVDKLLTNKTLMYVISILAIFVLLGYLKIRNLSAIILFLISGLVTMYFSNNIIVILLVSIIITSIFASNVPRREGFEDKKEESPEETPQTPEENPEKIPESKMKKDASPVVPNVPKIDNFANNNNKNKKSSTIDYAATVEDAYSQLNGLIGSEGVANLTKDTKNLMDHQLKLAESMKSMGSLVEGLGPMLSQAQQIMGGLDNKSFGGDLATLAKKFNSK